MNKFLFVYVLFFIGLVGCSTSQELTYRPVNSSELWNIRIDWGIVTGKQIGRAHV